jgi:hypothetical protein
MRRHPGTFVAGLLFMAIGIAYLLEELDVWEVRPGRLWPIALIVVGAVVLFAGPPAERDSKPTVDEHRDDANGGT